MINSLPAVKHEDNRRTLVEWIKDFPVRSCKVVITKSIQDIGDHYHNDKDEIFYLLKGSGILTLDGRTETFKEGDTAFIPRGSRHTFRLEEGAIMLGAGTKPYDEHDEHK